MHAKVHSDDRHIRNAAYESPDPTGRMSYELRIIISENNERWLKVNGKFMTDAMGRKISLIEIMQDITMQKQSAEQLEQLVEERTAEIRRSNKDLSEFAHVVSHDILEPVRKISIFNSIIESDYADILEERGQLYIKRVKAATQRMSNMIEGVLTYSAINAAGYPIQEVSLNDIVENISTELELLIEEKNAVLVHTDLPIMEGSPILLHQLFYNLINNALKFAKKYEEPLIVIGSNIIMIDKEEFVKITITDNGIGFDQEFSSRIFNVFERLHSKDDYEGTGLGLALCQKIIQRHNGTLSAVGTLGEGAIFTVTLPLRQSSEKL